MPGASVPSNSCKSCALAQVMKTTKVWNAEGSSRCSSLKTGTSRWPLNRWPVEAPSCRDRKSTRLNSSHLVISYAVFCLKKKKKRAYTIDTEQSQQYRDACVSTIDTI